MDPSALMDDVWKRLDGLVEHASTSDLRWHRLQLYAAWRMRSWGLPAPGELVALERQAAAIRLALPAVLSQVRAAYEGPMVLLKGVEVAALYPTQALRPSSDVDLLVHDADAVYRRLRDHGFVRLEEQAPHSDEHHHLPPLLWPGLPGGVEIHRAPNWPTWLEPPPTPGLIETACEASVVGHGIQRLPPAAHTLVLVAHLWRDDPVGRVGQLLDVFLMASKADGATIDALADRWGLRRLWRATREAANRLLLGLDHGSLATRALVRRSEQLRQRTVLESKLVEVCAPFFGLSPTRAAVAAARQTRSVLLPTEDEGWLEKARALRQVLSPISIAADRDVETRPRD